MLKVLVVAAALASAVSVTSAESPQAVTPRGEDGRALFLTYCSSCHGTSGRGDGPAADSLRTRPVDLTQLARITDGVFVAERVKRMIDGRDRYVKAHGSIEMPVWGDAFKQSADLTEAGVRARIDAIVRYLQSIQQRLG